MLDDPKGMAAFIASQDASGLVPVSQAEYAPLRQLMDASLPH